ncbi:MAG: hypothetical protein IKK11_04630, partial [Oscillospiraceae bacterium]|nr:hypothetical protein [Oscillospiraceae bacterium]
SYTLSINSGNVVLKGNTTITANDEGAYAYAFDACKFKTYDAPTVTVESSVKIYGKVEVTGGNLILKNKITRPMVYTSGTVTLVDDGYIAAPAGYYFDNGVLTLDIRNAVAKIGDKYFDTMAEAYEAAGNGDTITLLKSITDAGIEIKKDITIDFAGYIWSVKPPVSGTSYAMKIASGVEVTLKSTGAMGRLQINGAAETEFDTLIYNEGILHTSNMKLNGAALNKGDTAYTVYNAGTVDFVGTVFNKNVNIPNGYKLFNA